VSALGHTESASVVENNVAPDCTNSGSYDNVIYCSVCSVELSRETVTIDALGHTEAVDAQVNPSCTASGLTEGLHCSVCEAVLTPQFVIKPLGHTHKEIVTAPTCTDNGYTTHMCSLCGDTYVDNAIPALGHNWEDATYEEPKTCILCGKTDGEPLIKEEEEETDSESSDNKPNVSDSSSESISNSTGESSGCGSVISGSAITLFSLVGGAVVVLFRKKEEM
jgi:hypothetical protein